MSGRNTTMTCPLNLRKEFHLFTFIRDIERQFGFLGKVRRGVCGRFASLPAPRHPGRGGDWWCSSGNFPVFNFLIFLIFKTRAASLSVSSRPRPSPHFLQLCVKLLIYLWLRSHKGSRSQQIRQNPCWLKSPHRWKTLSP